MRLKENFFKNNTITVARQLLGKHLVRRVAGRIMRAKIIETEAYHGQYDRASHASRGMTERTKIMFGPPGHIYVYLVYGMYYCLNFVTMREGFPAAVLIRRAVMQNDREKYKEFNGPGILCRELRISRRLNNLPPDNNQLWIEDDGERLGRGTIMRAKRIGVDYAGMWKNKLWRFYVTL